MAQRAGSFVRAPVGALALTRTVGRGEARATHCRRLTASGTDIVVLLVARSLTVISLNGLLGLVVVVGEDLALDRRPGWRVLHGPARAERLFVVVGEEGRSLDRCGEGR